MTGKQKILQAVAATLCVSCLIVAPANAEPQQAAGPAQKIAAALAQKPDYAGYVWRVDAPDVARLPRNFRTAQAKFKHLDVQRYPQIANYVPPRTGLNDLRLSGSGQFSAAEFKILLKKLRTKTNGPIYDVDLRQETHGFFNGTAVSWYGYHDWGNFGKSHAEVIADENARLAAALHHEVTEKTFLKHKKDKRTQVYVQEAVNEKQLVEAAGVHYFRITATDHLWPEAQCIDSFIEFYKQLPADAWVHFHCQAGVGRTTIFMAMYDMMKNPQLPLKAILARQYQIGGNYVGRTAIGTGVRDWKAPYYNDKAHMIKLFYAYVQQNHAADYPQTWSQWLAAQKNK